ncbi:MAG TPA: amidase domain-containing protein [Clostridium sp.]|uniref:amidase domain-containing protein n=1 Tax=Clostridium sp. TaxID=1506 RepID=UPI002F9447C9
MKQHIRKICISITILSFVLLGSLCYKSYNFNDIAISTIASVNSDQTEIIKIMENIYKDRCSMFITRDITNLPNYYDTSQKFGKWSLEHEVKRLSYFNDWSIKRDMNFLKVESIPEVKKITNTKIGIRLLIDEYYKFEYAYKNDIPSTKNIFGVGITHSIELIKNGDKWIIYNDCYLDCFEDALKSYSGEIKGLKLNNDKAPTFRLENCPKIPFELNVVTKGQYNKINAVKYADKYCGVPWASENPTRFNKIYKNYTGIGGNCTNYVSQSIGDKEGGGLPFDDAWHCTYKKYDGAEGSCAWVNAYEFKKYLTYSGKAKIVGKGTFKELTSRIPGYPCGAIQKLDMGDLICYAKGNVIDHFAIVTSFDSHGYPLVNTHTIERYHVPWDLGWGDKDIKFYLIHVK